MCGENYAKVCERRAAAGRRITPACAGKTAFSAAAFSAAADHPRVCGENKLVDKGAIVRGGSPPRVRGKRFYHDCKVSTHRITPACAGKTSRMSQTLRERSDHPRVCGENAAESR